MIPPHDLSSPATVVVVGSLHLDIMVQAPDRPRQGETLPGTAWWLNPGGKGANQAVEAARFGAEVAMVGRVGDDDFGRRLRAHLHDRGVNADDVFTEAGAGSGMSVAILDPGGDYGAVIVSGVNGHLGPADLNRAAPRLAAARWVVLQNEIPAATNLEAARRARAHRAQRKDDRYQGQILEQEHRKGCAAERARRARDGQHERGGRQRQCQPERDRGLPAMAERRQGAADDGRRHHQFGRARSEHLRAHRPQPAERQVQADGEEQQHDADLRHRLHGRWIGDRDVIQPRQPLDPAAETRGTD